MTAAADGGGQTRFARSQLCDSRSSPFSPQLLTALRGVAYSHDNARPLSHLYELHRCQPRQQLGLVVVNHEWSCARPSTDDEQQQQQQQQPWPDTQPPSVNHKQQCRTLAAVRQPVRLCVPAAAAGTTASCRANPHKLRLAQRQGKSGP